MTEHLKVDELRPGFTVLTLNRPEKRNALNIPLLEALCSALDDVAARKSQRALVIRGAGAVFCAGLDLKEAQDPARREKSGSLVREALQKVYTCPCVTIAVVQGAALAGGAGLMTACDIAIATVGSSFGFPEVRRGLVAGLIMTFLRRQLHERHARELLLLGEIIEADRAKDIGLVTRVVPSDMLDEVLESHLDQIQKTAPGAVCDTKAFFDKLWHHPLETDLAQAHEIHAKMRGSAEAEEGLAAFFEKRRPTWDR